MKVVDRAFKAFFALIEKARKGEYRFCNIKLPHYRPKDSLFNLVLSSNAISIKDKNLNVPMSMTFIEVVTISTSSVALILARRIIRTSRKLVLGALENS